MIDAAARSLAGPDALLSRWNQENHFDSELIRRENQESSGPGRSAMSGQVVLYFEDQADALRFALAAGSVMAGDIAEFTSELVEETARVTRIRLDAVNAVAAKKGSPVRVA
jgi:hypothetical protein